MLLLDPLKLELEKNVLIEASAGTGKTYTITTLFTRLVVKGFNVDSILVVTFTEAAAAELKHRIRQRLVSSLSVLEKNDGLREKDQLDLYLLQGSKKETAQRISRIKQAIVCFDEASIMTIHSFCFRILRENAFETGALFNVKLIPDTKSIIKDIVIDFMSVEINDLDPLFLKFLKKKNFKITNLVSLFTRFISRPEAKIIPDPDHVKFCDVSRDYKNICLKLLKTLKVCSEEIKEIFLNHPGVNRRSYSRKSVEKWLETAEKDLLKFYVKNDDDAGISISAGTGAVNNSCEINKTKNIDGFKTAGITYSAGHIFNMTEKGDSLYKFTNSRLREKNKKNCPVPCHAFFDLCEKLLELSRVFEENITALKIKFFTFVMKELEIKKERLGICFFDDIINGLADALESKNADMLVHGIREEFSAVLIDEFQDTDQRQYSIFSKVFSGTLSPFFMIGDPKQAIYAFRGGDIFAYLRAVKDTKGRAYTLEKNWRSDPLLVNAVNTVFMKKENPFLFNEIGFNPVVTPDTAENRFMKNRSLCPAFQFLFINAKSGDTDKQGFIKKDWAKKNLPLIVADDIASLLMSDDSIKIKDGQCKPLALDDIAVLVRTNIQAESMNNALSAAGIPSYISKTGSVFDSKEAIEISDLLAAVLEPENTGFINAALCGGLFGLSGMDIFLLDPDNLPDSVDSVDSNNSDNSENSGYSDNPDGVERERSEIFFNRSFWRASFKKWKRIWEKNGVIRMLQGIFYSDNTMQEENRISERSLTNYYHLAELLHRAECEKHLSPFALFKWFLNQLVPDMREEYSDELRLETDAGAISIVTVHKSKGMEYPVVYLPYLWEGVVHAEKDDNPVFHDQNDADRETIDLGSNTVDLSRQRAVFEEQAENMRLLYVGLTRAASMCRIIWGNFKSVEKSSFFRLLHLQDNFSEESMIEDINDLTEQSLNGISIDFYEKNETHRWYGDNAADKKTLVHKKLPFEIVQEWVISSFSRLSSGHDTKRKEQEVKSDIFADNEIPEKYNEKQNTKISLADFPKGPIPGELIHDVFEHIDFMGEKSFLKEVIKTKIVQYGFDPLKWTDPLTKAFSEILATCLFHHPGVTDHKESQGTGDIGKQEIFSLKDIEKDNRLNEMEFIFPFKPFSKQMLADIFRNHFNNKAFISYADKILDLEFDAVKGFMRGFIDLVFKFKKKWYVIDYKSNYLGSRYSDYSKAAMVSSMMEHHYFLQYHLYVTAVHRYLGLRMKDYNYNLHFGGVLYLFIRGMHPDSGPDSGVFYHRPDYEMIKRLSELF